MLPTWQPGQSVLLHYPPVLRCATVPDPTLRRRNPGLEECQCLASLDSQSNSHVIGDKRYAAQLRIAQMPIQVASVLDSC